jgi:hypothetical protein
MLVVVTHISIFASFINSEIPHVVLVIVAVEKRHRISSLNSREPSTQHHVLDMRDVVNTRAKIADVCIDIVFVR